MENEDIYNENINAILDIINQKHNLVQAPRSKEILEILRIMFDAEDAAVGAYMSSIPESPDVIAERLNINKEKLVPILEKMADKGTVLRIGEKENYFYGIFSTDIGLFETAFGKGEISEKTKRLAKLWTDYYDGPWHDCFHQNKTSMARIVPIEKKIPAQQEVLPYEKVSQIIEKATFRSLTNCACKSAKILSGEGCALNAPTEVCMLFGEIGRSLVAKGFAKEISKEKAFEIAKTAEDLGLVHLTVNVKNQIDVLCSCCPCCCVSLRGIIKYDRPNAVASSGYYASVVRNLCDGCKEFDSPRCIEHCPVGAISIKNNMVFGNANRCIGCGICAHFCPIEGAIALKKKKDVSEPMEDIADLMTTLIGERV